MVCFVLLERVVLVRVKPFRSFRLRPGDGSGRSDLIQGSTLPRLSPSRRSRFNFRL
jgi:hypothetical protein